MQIEELQQSIKPRAYGQNLDKARLKGCLASKTSKRRENTISSKKRRFPFSEKFGTSSCLRWRK